MPESLANAIEDPRGSSADQLLERKGYDALEGVTHNWAVEGSLGRFSPTQLPGTSEWRSAAYAVYDLTPLDYAGPSLIRLRWDTPPASYSGLWFGLANWETGRWDWRRGSSINQYFFYEQETAYISAVSGRMLVAVLLCDQPEAVLARVQLGYDQPIYFVSTGSGLQAVRPDGQQRWNFATGATGIGSPAVAADGTVYMGAADGKLYALSPAGSELWSYPTASNFICSPCIDGQGAIYCGNNSGTIFVLNPDGSLKWSAQMDGASHEGAAVDLDGNVYFPSWVNYLYAFTSAGEPAWSTDTGNLMYHHPVVGDNGEVYVACWSNKLFALGLSDGLEAWSLNIGEWNCGAPALAADGTVYAPSSVFGLGDMSLFALDPDGAEKWKFSAEGMFSTPVVDANGDLYFAIDDGRVVSLDSAGQLRWEFPFDGLANSTPALGADGTLYVVESTGVLLAIGPGAGLF